MIGMTDQYAPMTPEQMTGVPLAYQNIKNVNATGNMLTDGVLSGYAWAGGSITYSFPNSKKDYDYGGEPNSFSAVGGKIRDSAQFILDKSYGGKANDGFSVEGFTDLNVKKGSDGNATLRYAESNAPNPTAYAYYPNKDERGGDVWFGKDFNGVAQGYEDSRSGNYQFATVIHETGHALGLKHGHAASSFDLITTTLDYNYNSLEYSVMTYNSFVGDSADGYKNEKFSFPQTYMMADISALQHMYGANFNVNDGNTTYRWKPDSGNTWVNGKVGIDATSNRIFATIWDGGGKHDKYDLRSYDNNVSVDLRPGQESTFRSAQLADLGANSFGGPGAHMARGNIFNALLYKRDERSLIEDAEGGSGNDRLTGNAAKNVLDGNGGDDRLNGLAGNDIYKGGSGSDTFIFGSGGDKDVIRDFDIGKDRIDLSAWNFATIDDVRAIADNQRGDLVLIFGNGDNLTIANRDVNDIDRMDFLLA